MAKKKKKSSRAGEINFYKAMTVLGLILAGALAYMFLGSAPSLSRHDFHVATDPPEKCLTCHMTQVKSAPIMPHRPMESCDFCHKPAQP
ncbi:MAG: hypothetical protein GWM98_27035 [Nitrospinaceae bacterium]|nr:hypothetical protein [Nitrospinaceae bacterium]NIR57440.1 hypothetical protein [Nitrospinaceae bacterium]NIS87907.1 hypothetical protein [Nitrospinaceae bacterium]NIT84776.1 hypothetical protein [Nitrospinaceae bacterium]NIU46950.1 hypothetical protein [Nitrospinaceae bacterium]